MNIKNKKIACLMILLLFTACKSKEHLFFCEGVNEKEEGVKCGKTFTTGDLTALIKVKQNFETESLNISIFEKKEFKNKPVDSFSIKVDPEKNTATATLMFYNEGEYLVTVSKKEAGEIAKGEIKVIDTY